MEKKQSVLVIDDSATVRRLAELGLSEEGYTVYTAEDGDVGLEIAKREMPSIILVDFIMPKMNGFQLCKNIRADSSLAQVPIILITSKGEDVGHGFEEHFSIDHYLQKPFETETLIRTVNDVLLVKADHDGPSNGEIREESPESTAPDTPLLEANVLPDTPPSESPEYTVQDTGVEYPAYTLPENISFVEISGTDADYTSDELEGIPTAVSSETHDEGQEAGYDSLDDTIPEPVFSNADFAAMEEKMREPFVMDLELPADSVCQEVPSGTVTPEEAPLPAYADESETVIPSPAGHPGVGRQSVLVIDDSPTVRKLAELGLSEEGYTVYTAEDGDVGLEIAKREIPSIILVDFIMPKMNGFQLCKNIRADAALSDIPIVLITSKGKDVGQGFDDKFSIAQYLQKPFETETLAKTVKEVLACRIEQAVQSPSETYEEAPDMSVQGSGVPDERVETPESSASCIPVQDAEVSHVQEASDGSDVQEMLHHDQTAPEALSDVPPESADSPVTDVPAQSAASPDNGYATMLDDMKKELRLYFGQELTAMVKSAVSQSLKEADLVRSLRPALSGDVAHIPATHVLHLVSTSRLTGKLSVFSSSFTSEMYFENGMIAFASVSGTGSGLCLEKILEEKGKAGQKETIRVLNEARGDSLAAGIALLKRNLIDGTELSDCYRKLIRHALERIVAVSSGHFYFEIMPLPREAGNTGIRVSPDAFLDTHSSDQKDGSH